MAEVHSSMAEEEVATEEKTVVDTTTITAIRSAIQDGAEACIGMIGTGTGIEAETSMIGEEEECTTGMDRAGEKDRLKEEA